MYFIFVCWLQQNWSNYFCLSYFSFKKCWLIRRTWHKKEWTRYLLQKVIKNKQQKSNFTDQHAILIKEIYKVKVLKNKIVGKKLHWKILNREKEKSTKIKDNWISTKKWLTSNFLPAEKRKSLDRKLKDKKKQRKWPCKNND